MNKPLRWSVASVSVIVLSLLSYFFADRGAALWFHAQEPGGWYDLFSLITYAGESQWYLIAGMVLFVWFRKSNPPKAALGLFLFSSVAVAGLLADLIKYLVGRARPSLYFSDNFYGFGFLRYDTEWISFPSGHSATAFGVAMVLALLYPRWRILVISTALLIAFSRLFLARHYISDVLAGSFLGVASTVLLYNLHFKSRVNAPQATKI